VDLGNSRNAELPICTSGNFRLPKTASERMSDMAISGVLGRLAANNWVDQRQINASSHNILAAIQMDITPAIQIDIGN